MAMIHALKIPPTPKQNYYGLLCLLFLDNWSHSNTSAEMLIWLKKNYQLLNKNTKMVLFLSLTNINSKKIKAKKLLPTQMHVLS